MTEDRSEFGQVVARDLKQMAQRLGAAGAEFGVAFGHRDGVAPKPPASHQPTCAWASQDPLQCQCGYFNPVGQAD